MQGDFHSVFKGSGLEFDDVRQYQYGDDVRAIDWNVSAKGHGTFIKTFKEEKEQTIFFLLDVSASQQIGRKGSKKLDITKELAGVLALAATNEGSQTGMIAFSDQPEVYVKPGKGTKHAMHFINKLVDLKPQSRLTDLNRAILYALNLISKRSIIIVISDFIDNGYENHLKALARKHDVVAIHIFDEQEAKFPKLGVVPLVDMEANKTIWVNSSAPWFKSVLEKRFQSNSLWVEKLLKGQQANYLKIHTNEDYVPKLIKLFRYRNRSRKIA